MYVHQSRLQVNQQLVDVIIRMNRICRESARWPSAAESFSSLDDDDVAAAVTSM